QAPQMNQAPQMENPLDQTAMNEQASLATQEASQLLEQAKALAEQAHAAAAHAQNLNVARDQQDARAEAWAFDPQHPGREDAENDVHGTWDALDRREDEAGAAEIMYNSAWDSTSDSQRGERPITEAVALAMSNPVHYEKTLSRTKAAEEQKMTPDTFSRSYKQVTERGQKEGQAYLESLVDGMSLSETAKTLAQAELDKNQAAESFLKNKLDDKIIASAETSTTELQDSGAALDVWTGRADKIKQQYKQNIVNAAHAEALQVESDSVYDEAKAENDRRDIDAAHTEALQIESDNVYDEAKAENDARNQAANVKTDTAVDQAKANATKTSSAKKSIFSNFDAAVAAEKSPFIGKDHKPEQQDTAEESKKRGRMASFIGRVSTKLFGDRETRYSNFDEQVDNQTNVIPVAANVQPVATPDQAPSTPDVKDGQNQVPQGNTGDLIPLQHPSDEELANDKKRDRRAVGVIALGLAALSLTAAALFNQAQDDERPKAKTPAPAAVEASGKKTQVEDDNPAKRNLKPAANQGGRTVVFKQGGTDGKLAQGETIWSDVEEELENNGVIPVRGSHTNPAALAEIADEKNRILKLNTLSEEEAEKMPTGATYRK
ncbi:MAG TPA: hypothetical protein VK983_01295, partial [Candidatus Limnocylindrales bacterium]|nr:hypothetical protein [Candidatus Limnocylindrales bacterium]